MANATDNFVYARTLNEVGGSARYARWIPLAIALSMVSCDGCYCTETEDDGCGPADEGDTCGSDWHCASWLGCCEGICSYDCPTDDPCADYGDCPDAAPPPSATITVTVEGYGRVRAAGGAIDCNADEVCTAAVVIGDTLELTAEPYLGGAVTWSGLPGGFTRFIVSSSREITATFTGALGRWPVRIGGAGDDSATGVALHPAGLIVAVGMISNEVTVGGDVLISNGSSDVAIVAFEADGTPLWARSIGATGEDYAAGVAIDPVTADIIVAGSCAGPLDFGDGVTRCAAGNSDAFVMALQLDGSLRWARTLGGVSWESILDIAVGDDGRITLVGKHWAPFTLDTIDLDAQLGVFVASFDSTGATRWARSFQSGALAFVIEVVAAGSGVVIGGVFDEIDFGAGTLTAGGSTDAFVAAIADGGTISWSRVISGTGSDFVWGLDRLADGTIAVLGNYELALDLGGGPISAWGNSDLFIAELDSGGNHLWSDHAGGPGPDQAAGICADGSGGWYIADLFEEELWVDIVPRPGPGEADIGWIHLGADRAIESFGIYGGATYDAPTDIACDDLSMVLTGVVTGTARFDGFTTQGGPDSDWFIARVPR